MLVRVPVLPRTNDLKGESWRNWTTSQRVSKGLQARLGMIPTAGEGVLWEGESLIISKYRMF